MVARYSPDTDPVILWAEFNGWMLDEQGWSRWTRKARISAVKRAHAFIHSQYGRTLLRASAEQVIGFLSASPTPRTRNTYLSALRAFYRFAREKRHRRGDPTKELRRVKEPRALPRPLPTKQPRRLLFGAQRVGPRAYVIVSILLYTGLRRSEAAWLNWADVSIEAMQIRVMGKGSKERIVPISSRLLPVLVGWRSASSTGWLFPSSQDSSRPIGVMGLWTEVKEAAAEAKLRGVTPHRLRHTFATEYLRRGGNIRELQQILGHASLASTQVYTLIITDDLRPGMDRLDFGA